MQLLSLILQVVTTLLFIASVTLLFGLSTRANRENFEARSILGALYASEDIVRNAHLYKSPDIIIKALKQHEEVRAMVEEIRCRQYSLFCGVRFVPKTVYSLNFFIKEYQDALEEQQAISTRLQ